MTVKQKRMRHELNKDTLSRLYLREKRATRDIAEKTGWSPSAVRYRCIKYGIQLRPNTWNKIIKIKKSLLEKLYVKEKRSSAEIAEILSCDPQTVMARCKEYGIPPKGQRIRDITKRLLQKLYVREGRTTREIAQLLGCTAGPVQRCKEYGIPLRSPRFLKIAIGEETLRRLYVTEGRKIAEIARIVGCNYGTIALRVKRLGLNAEKREGR